MRELLENDQVGLDAIKFPEKYVRDKTSRERFRKCVASLVGDVVIDLNDEVAEYCDEFDYRDKLRDSNWVREITKEVVSGYLKQVKRSRISSFKDEWESALGALKKPMSTTVRSTA